MCISYQCQKYVIICIVASCIRRCNGNYCNDINYEIQTCYYN